MAGKVRTTMIEGAAGLLSQRGVEGTSLGDVLEATGAPRGSVYHHFPGGKNELLSEAARYAGSLLVGALEAADTSTPVEVIATFTGLWRSLLARSDLRAGCAVAAVVNSAPSSDQLRSVTADVFQRWIDVLAERLARSGVDTDTARSLAITSIAAMEGAVVLGRATRDLRLFDVTAEQLRSLAEQIADRQAGS